MARQGGYPLKNLKSLYKRGIQGDFIIPANPPTPFAKGGLKTANLPVAKRHSARAGTGACPCKPYTGFARVLHLFGY